MNESITLEVIGQNLNAIRSQLAARQIEIDRIRGELGRFVGAMITREMLSEVVHVLAGRISAFEALMEARMVRLEARMDRLEERLAGLETKVADGVARLHRSNQAVIPLLTRLRAQRPESIRGTS